LPPPWDEVSPLPPDVEFEVMLDGVMFLMLLDFFPLGFVVADGDEPGTGRAGVEGAVALAVLALPLDLLRLRLFFREKELDREPERERRLFPRPLSPPSDDLGGGGRGGYSGIVGPALWGCWL